MTVLHWPILHRRECLEFRPWDGSWRDGRPTLFSDDLEARVDALIVGWADNPDRVHEVTDTVAAYRQRDRELGEIYVSALASEDQDKARQAAFFLHQQWLPLSRYLTRQEHRLRHPGGDKPAPVLAIILLCVGAAVLLVIVLLLGQR